VKKVYVCRTRTVSAVNNLSFNRDLFMLKMQKYNRRYGQTAYTAALFPHMSKTRRFAAGKGYGKGGRTPTPVKRVILTAASSTRTSQKTTL